MEKVMSARLQQIAAKTLRYPKDAQIRQDNEYMMELIARAAWLLATGVLAINAQAKAEVSRFLLEAGDPCGGGETGSTPPPFGEARETSDGGVTWIDPAKEKERSDGDEKES